MAAIDYMKVLDIAAETLDTTSRKEIQALDLKLFKAVITKDDGSSQEIFIKINEFDLELSMEKKNLDKKEFQKWSGKFEFQLEQSFFKNIAIKTSETAHEYKIYIEI